jgi:hypothetical protein
LYPEASEIRSVRICGTATEEEEEEEEEEDDDDDDGGGGGQVCLS